MDAAIEEKDDGFPLLDVKVRNTGDQVAFLKTATFNVTDMFTVEDPMSYVETHIDVSWSYNVILPLRKTPYTRNVAISQAVKPNDVDRFTFALGHGGHRGSPFSFWPSTSDGKAPETGKPPSGIADADSNPEDADDLGLFVDPEVSIMRLSVEVVYNEDNQKVQSEPLIFLMPTPKHFIMAIGHPKFDAKEIVERNLQAIKAGRRLQGKATPGALALFKQAQ